MLELNVKRKLNSASFIILGHISVLSHEKTCKSLDIISHSIHTIRKGILRPMDRENTLSQAVGFCFLQIFYFVKDFIQQMRQRKDEHFNCGTATH